MIILIAAIVGLLKVRIQYLRTGFSVSPLIGSELWMISEFIIKVPIDYFFFT